MRIRCVKCATWLKKSLNIKKETALLENKIDLSQDPSALKWSVCAANSQLLIGRLWSEVMKKSPTGSLDLTGRTTPYLSAIGEALSPWLSQFPVAQRRPPAVFLSNNRSGGRRLARAVSRVAVEQQQRDGGGVNDGYFTEEPLKVIRRHKILTEKGQNQCLVFIATTRNRGQHIQSFCFGGCYSKL